MRTYEFTIKLTGNGNDVESAWENAVLQNGNAISMSDVVAVLIDEDEENDPSILQ